jgi:hypothetical protein
MYFARALAAFTLTAQAVAIGDRTDSLRDFEAICTENGFAFETHEVTTEDGYILNVYRIPGKIGEASDAAKPPVMF